MNTTPHYLANGAPDPKEMDRESLETAYECATNVLSEIRATLELKDGDDVKGAVRALRANLEGPPRVYGYAVTDRNENHRELVILGDPYHRAKAIEIAKKLGNAAEVHPLYDVGAIYTAPGGKYADEIAYNAARQ